MVKRYAAALLLAAGCASEPTSTSSKCPADSTAYGLTLPSGLGVSIGERGLNAAYGAIRDFFTQNPAATSQSGKARAADLAADAAARNAAAPMSEEQRRALRSQAGEWVETYAEKCKPGS